jgi:multiple sugar transport system substrate-binding protein
MRSLDWSWANEAPQVVRPELSRFPNEFGFAPAPAGCAGCVPAAYWAQDSWVIPANASVDRELLFQIVMEATQAKNETRVSDIAFVTRAARAGTTQSPYWMAAAQTVAQGAVGMDRKPYAYLAQAAVTDYALEALLGHLSAKEALDRAAAEYVSGMKSEGFTR